MNRTPLIHLGLASLLLIAAIVAYAFWYTKVSGMRAEVAALTAEAEAATIAAGEISSARSALAKLAEDEAYFGSYFVSTSTVVSYLEDIEGAGDAFGSSLEVVSVTPEGKARLAVSFRATGSFSAVMRTIGAMEYGAHDAIIGNLNVETNASSEGAWVASGVISVGMMPAGSAPEAAPASAPVTDLLP